jgi:PAS domain S-box-containing protein
VTRRTATTAGPGNDLRRLRALVSDIDAVVWEVDATTGRFVFVSDASRIILGYPPEAFLDEPDLWADRLHPDDRDAMLTSFLAETSGPGSHDLEYRFRRGDGEIVWLRGIGHAVVDEHGSPVAVRGLMIDITRRKLAEPSGGGEPASTGGEARGLLANVSHELRTPLAAVLGLAVTLEQQGLDEEDARDLAARIVANARRLDRMVTDLIDLERLSHGRIEPAWQTVDIGTLTARIARESGIAGGRRVEVATEEAVAEADVAQVERILENLLANAARRTRPDASLRVAARPDRGGVVIEVDDDGPAVPPDRRRATFEQVNRLGEPVPGAEIGLVLVARFAALHGGRAWVQEGQSGGASFRVWLPRWRA